MTVNSLGICSSLGIYGWEHLEEMLLSILLTGESCLLIGGSGTTKTHGIRQLSRLIIPNGEDPSSTEKYFQAYDAPTVSFEDLCGIPDFHRLNEGKMVFLPSDMSIWLKICILVDELNRVSPDIQGKLLQLILSRRIMGAPTQVTHLFAAMNPLDYAGTQELDKALADRFSYLLQVPGSPDLSETDRLMAIQSNGSDSLTGMKDFNKNLVQAFIAAENIVEPSKSPKVSESSVRHAIQIFRELRTEIFGQRDYTLEQAKGTLIVDVANIYRLPVAEYLNQIVEQNKSSILKDNLEPTVEQRELLATIPSPRRLGMIRRNVEVRLAIRIASSPVPLSTDEIIFITKECFTKGMTNQVMRTNQYDISQYDLAHPIASEVLKSVGSPWTYRVVTEKNPIKALAMTLSFLRSEPSLVDTQIDRTMSVPQGSSTIANGELIESLKLDLGNPNCFKESGVLHKVITPILVALYSAPLIDLDSTVLNVMSINKVAHRVRDAITYVRNRNTTGDLIVLDSDLCGAQFSLLDKSFESLAETDSNYKVTRLLFALACRNLATAGALNKESNACMAMKNLYEDLLVIHEEIKSFLFPVYRSLFFESYLPTGMTSEQHINEMKAFSKRVRGIPDYIIEPTIVSKEIKEIVVDVRNEELNLLTEICPEALDHIKEQLSKADAVIIDLLMERLESQLV